MLKKIWCSFLALVLIVSASSGSALATEQNEVVPFSLNVPTESWSLSDDGDYPADLQIVGKGWLYTNRYFYSNGSGNIYVDYDLTAEGNTVVEFGLYDIAESKMVATWSTEEFGTDGIVASMYWLNLNKSHGYAIAFRSTVETVTGSATIRS